MEKNYNSEMDSDSENNNSDESLGYDYYYA